MSPIFHGKNVPANWTLRLFQQRQLASVFHLVIILGQDKHGYNNHLLKISDELLLLNEKRENKWNNDCEGIEK